MFVFLCRTLKNISALAVISVMLVNTITNADSTESDILNQIAPRA